MDWKTLIQTRKTNYLWEDTPVSKEIITDACKEVYNYVPSKNRKFPYVVTVQSNNDPEIKKEIMTICHRNLDLTAEDDPGNPQVLAPTLIAFSRRDFKDLETKYQKTYTWTDETLERRGFLEIGIVATYLMLALTTRGVQTAFCQNIGQDAYRAKEIFGTEYPVRLLMAVGYERKEDSNEFLDPRTNKSKQAMLTDRDLLDKCYPRPDFDKIFKIKI